MNRRVASVKTRPRRARVEMLIDEAIVEPGERHSLRAPLAEADAMAPAVTTEPHRSGRCSRRTVRRIGGARAAEGRLRRFRFVGIEGLLELATLVLQAGESNDGLSPQAVQLAVVVRNGGHLAGDRIGARLQR